MIIIIKHIFVYGEKILVFSTMVYRIHHGIQYTVELEYAVYYGYIVL